MMKHDEGGVAPMSFSARFALWLLSDPMETQTLLLLRQQ